MKQQMRQHWQKLATKIDALTLRERVMVFAVAALTVVMAVNALLLDPQYAAQKRLSDKVRQEQSVIAALRAEIQQKTSPQQSEAERAGKLRLEQLQQQTEQLHLRLAELQSGLVSPDKMSALLEDLVQQNRGLQLLSLKTLPVSSLMDAVTPETSTAGKPAAAAAAGVAKASPAGPVASPAASLVYKHGVEIVVQGGYLDLLNYLAQLEAMPWQLLWVKAKLDARDYPNSTLTLNLSTLSLDKQWLNL